MFLVVRRSSVRRAVLPLAVAALVAGGSTTPAQAAAPRGPRCGETVTHNTTLKADLICPRGNGLVIGADGITVNLNGHTITGTFSGKPGFPNVGIQAKKRHGVRVTGPGLVRRFDSGVALEDMTDSVAQNLTVRRNDFGLGMGGRGNLVVGVTATKNLHGGIGVGDGSTVSGSTASDNGPDAVGIGVGSDASVLGNVISGNHIAVDMIFGDNNLVAGNRITGGGIHVFGDHNQILRNRVVRGGIVVGNFIGNVLDGNAIDRAPEFGIIVQVEASDFTPPRNTVVRNNVVTRSAEVGIEIDGERGSRVIGNRVSRSGGDGISVDEPGSTVTRNRARSNAGYGIFAVPDVKDGGGNRASGNGKPEQCAGVRCRP